ncbi:MAG: hypothetical protein ACK56F_13495, partial [bacterium]
MFTLLRRAHGERVAQIRRAHVTRQCLEPMRVAVLGRRRRTHPFASAQDRPQAELTANGTFNATAFC